MSFSTTSAGLAAVGYVFDGAAQCRKCRSSIEWYLTPRNKRIPMDLPGEDNERKSHWATCPNAEEFRGTGQRDAVECHCHCHRIPGVKHMVACCQTCPKCQKRIVCACYHDHVAGCTAPVAPLEVQRGA